MPYTQPSTAQGKTVKIQDRILEAVEKRLASAPLGDNVIDRTLGTAIDTVIALQGLLDDGELVMKLVTPPAPGRKVVARLKVRPRPAGLTRAFRTARAIDRQIET